jgi:hypothetical protein
MSLILDGTSGLFGNVTGGDISGNFIGLNGNGSSLTATATGSTTARSLANRFADIYNVKDFGAVGDGVVDDTDAIKAAINAVDLIGGGAVYVPRGIYIISDSFNVPSNTLINGDGDESIIRCASTMLAPTYNPTNIAAGFRVFLLYNVSNIRITNLRIDSSLVYQPQGSTPSTWRARDVYSYGASDVSVDNCSFLSSGAATVFTNSSKYRVVNNDIVCQSVNGIPNHDGIIDQWWGSHDFVISGNRIDGQVTLGKHAILLTATNSDGSTGTPMYNAVISNNIVKNCEYGIWVMGRNGRCYSISVADNIISNISLHNGISVSNSDGIAVVGNTTLNTFRSGVAIFSESGFPLGCTGVVISGNTISNAGTGNTTGSNSERSGISVVATAANSSNLVVGNTVIGNTHTYPVFLGTDGVEHIGGSYAIGSIGVYQNLGVGSIVRFGGGGTSDSIYWTRNSESNKLTTIQNSISATSQAVTLKFDNGAIDFKNAGSANMFRVTNIATAVNGVQVYPNPTGSGPIVSAIGSDTNIDLRLGAQGTGSIIPNVNNSISLGKSGALWSSVWAQNGTIQTSDEREKTEISDSLLGINFINSLRPVSYKFKIGKNVVTKTDENGLPKKIESVAGERVHYGLLAQEVKSAIPEGTDFGGWILTDKNDNDSAQGLRYEEFIAPMIKAIQELSVKVSALETK